MGFYTLILLAGLQAIPADLYEAAEWTRAARGGRSAHHAAAPDAEPVVVLVLGLIRAVQIFDEVYVLTGGGPGSATTFIVQFIYQTGFAETVRQYGLAAAASLVLALCCWCSRCCSCAGKMRREPRRCSREHAHGAARPRPAGTGPTGFLWLSAARVLLMFGPVLWLVLSSFKSAAALNEFPPQLLPYGQKSVTVPGQEKPLPLFRVTTRRHAARLAEVRRIGIQATTGRSATPEQDHGPHPRPQAGDANSRRDGELLRDVRQVLLRALSLEQRVHHGRGDADHAAVQRHGRVRAVEIPLQRPQGGVPAHHLDPDDSADDHPGAQLPGRVELGLLNSLWGVIWPAVATPTGVFLLRQYMLTIPDELIDAARMDHASEWRIFWRIILPLSAPALAVLAIFSVMWRWNDFLWPLIVLSRTESSPCSLRSTRSRAS